MDDLPSNAEVMRRKEAWVRDVPGRFASLDIALDGLWLGVSCRNGRIRWTLCGSPISRAKALGVMDEHGLVWPVRETVSN